MVYLQDPFPLPYQHALKLRMGRTTLSLQAKRNWTSALRNMLGSPIPSNELLSPTPDDIQCILASCTTPGEDDMAHTIKVQCIRGGWCTGFFSVCAALVNVLFY